MPERPNESDVIVGTPRPWQRRSADHGVDGSRIAHGRDDCGHRTVAQTTTEAQVRRHGSPRDSQP